MEGLLATLVLAGAMLGALVLLGRTWPRSSRLGGYRAGLRGSRDAASDAAPDDGPIPEDDDVRWQWHDPVPPLDDVSRAAVLPTDPERGPTSDP